MAVQEAAGDPGQRMRASHMDREAVVAVLRNAYIAGRLTLDEFDERTSAAYASKTWGELGALTADLPETPELGADLPGPPPVPDGPPAVTGRVTPVARRRPRPRLWPVILISVLGLASGSALLAVVAIVTGVVAHMVVSLIEGWRDGGKELR